MPYLILIFAILAFYHYFLENVIVPARRLALEEKLIESSIKFGKLECSKKTDLSTKDYNIIKDMVVDTYVFFSQHNLVEIYYKEIVQYLKYIFRLQVPDQRRIDEKIEKENFISEIERNKNINVTTAFGDYQITVKEVYMTNMLGWSVYAFPIVIYLMIVHMRKTPFKKWLKLKNGTEMLVSALFDYQEKFALISQNNTKLRAYEKRASDIPHNHNARLFHLYK